MHASSGRPLYLPAALMLLLPVIKLKQDSRRSKSILIYSQSAPVSGVLDLVASSPGATNGSVATLLLAAPCQTLQPQTDQPSTRLRNKTHPRVCLCGVNMFACVRQLIQLRCYLTFGILYHLFINRVIPRVTITTCLVSFY